MAPDLRQRHVTIAFALVGVAGLLSSRHLGGTFGRMHGANLAFSFGAFFLLRLFPFFEQRGAGLTAASALLLVTAAELAQHLGLYPGTYDPRDLAFNALGVLLAMGVNAAQRRRGRSDRA